MLKNYCAIHNIYVIGIYRDANTELDFGTPGFNKLLNFLKQNIGVANLLLFTTWEKFTYDYDLAMVMADRLGDLGVEARAIQENNMLIECL